MEWVEVPVVSPGKEQQCFAVVWQALEDRQYVHGLDQPDQEIVLVVGVEVDILLED